MSRRTIETLILCLILSLCIVILYYHNRNSQRKLAGNHASVLRHNGEGEESGMLDNPEARIKWEFNRLKDPATGTIPQDIRWKELQFVKNLPKDKDFGLKSVKWVKRGPYNVGGRTRGIALDVNDENTIVAGGVSGGIWRSTDAGATWSEQTTADQLHNVSCLTQDVRAGKRNIWYYGTGELYGDSPSATGAFYLGNGIFKSLDSGKTWQSLPSTASNSPQKFDSFWDMIWKIVIDPSRQDSDVVYAASLGTVFQSVDGGSTWKTVLGGGTNYSLFADITVTRNGVAYATLGKEKNTNTLGGIYRSVDGVKWTNITPAGFPANFYRVVIGVNPSNENEVYFLGVSKNEGVLTHSYLKRTEWETFWKYNYLGGDGTGSDGIWKELTQNLPVRSKILANNYYTQGSYDMLVRVKPGNSNVVFIGGTNIYRSNDAFSTPDSVVQIGGYQINTGKPNYSMYKNHHPDQHNILFSPSDHDVMISANDGGIFRTYNNMNNTVEWQSLNNGYCTTQLYTVAIDEHTTSDIMVAGFQDNGSYFNSSIDPHSVWTMPMGGDGSFCEIIKGGENYYMSAQEGKTYKLILDGNGNRLNFARIDPIGGMSYQFVNPFAIDPNNKNIMYLAGGRKLWRNDSLTFIPINNTWDSISKGWYVFPDTLTTKDMTISALGISTNPPNVVYYGTNSQKVYRIDNANTRNSKRTNITTNYFSINDGSGQGGNVSCIAVDPDDANKVFVVFSNYNIYSLFYSINGGKNWLEVGGNLEFNEDGSGSGPSCRWLSILPFPNGKRIYFLGTSTGLYATDTLINETKSSHTVWVQVGADVIGNVVVDMVKTRTTDNLVVVATHGNGVFSTHINSFNDLQSVFSMSRDMNAQLKIFPNPASNFINISMSLTSPQTGNVYIYNQSGKLLKTYNAFRFKSDNERLIVNTSDLSNGIYYSVAVLDNRKVTAKFIVLR